MCAYNIVSMCPLHTRAVSPNTRWVEHQLMLSAQDRLYHEPQACWTSQSLSTCRPVSLAQLLVYFMPIGSGKGLKGPLLMLSLRTSNTPAVESSDQPLYTLSKAFQGAVCFTPSANSSDVPNSHTMPHVFFHAARPCVVVVNLVPECH